jgi:hypothetical protein
LPPRPRSRVSKVDPATAEVYWTFAQIIDPYGIDPDLPEEYLCVGQVYFVRSPESDIWVWFGDLSDATRDALWQRKHEHDDLSFLFADL